MVLMNVHVNPDTKWMQMNFVCPSQNAPMIHVVTMHLVPNWTMVKRAHVQVASPSTEYPLVLPVSIVLVMIVILTVQLVKILANVLKAFIHVPMEHQLGHVLKLQDHLTVNVSAVPALDLRL